MDTVTIGRAARSGIKSVRFEGVWYDVVHLCPGGTEVRVRCGNVTRDLPVFVPVVVRRN